MVGIVSSVVAIVSTSPAVAAVAAVYLFSKTSPFDDDTDGIAWLVSCSILGGMVNADDSGMNLSAILLASIVLNVLLTVISVANGCAGGSALRDDGCCCSCGLDFSVGAASFDGNNDKNNTKIVKLVRLNKLPVPLAWRPHRLAHMRYDFCLILLQHTRANVFFKIDFPFSYILFFVFVFS